MTPVLSLATGCGDEPVVIESPLVDDRDRVACETLLDALPDELAGEGRRLVSPAATLGAAWGDPTIVVTCGVDLPADFDRFAGCVEANGVGWFVPEEQESDPSSAVTLTAAGYRPVVQVRLPASYRPEGVAAAMAQLAQPVRDALELVEPCE